MLVLERRLQDNAKSKMDYTLGHRLYLCIVGNGIRTVTISKLAKVRA
jgi:hypothetical protein